MHCNRARERSRHLQIGRRPFTPFEQANTRIAASPGAEAVIKKILLKLLPPRLLKHVRAVDNYLKGDQELRYIRHLCDRRRTAVDVGANIGVYTYFMRRHSSRVYAYEPVPSLARFLRASFRGRDVIVRGSAVSNRAGKARLLMPVQQGRELHELSSLSQEFPEVAETRTFEVDTVRLDDEDIGEVGLIKIEVQQHEDAVLAGAQGTIRRQKPNLIVAWAPLLAKGDIRSSFASLFALGYRGYFLFERRLLSVDDYEPAVHANPANLGRHGRFITNVIFTTGQLE